MDTNGPEVIADPDGTGAEVSRRLFADSDTVVVSGPERDHQLQAAAIAVKLGAPMLVRYDDSVAAVDAEIERLGATRIIEVPGADEEVAETAPVAAATPGDDVAAISALEAANPLKLTMPPMLVTAVTSRPAGDGREHAHRHGAGHPGARAAVRLHRTLRRASGAGTQR